MGGTPSTKKTLKQAGRSANPDAASDHSACSSACGYRRDRRADHRLPWSLDAVSSRRSRSAGRSA
eukprot:8380916-Pyramimonas_sp.AAC.1